MCRHESMKRREIERNQMREKDPPDDFTRDMSDLYTIYICQKFGGKRGTYQMSRPQSSLGFPGMKSPKSGMGDIPGIEVLVHEVPSGSPSHGAQEKGSVHGHKNDSQLPREGCNRPVHWLGRLGTDT